MSRNKKPCPHCGGDMHRQSKKCRACYEADRAAPENYINRTCPVCDVGFTVHKSQIERGQGIYCSRSCARTGSPTRKRTQVQVTCHVCETEFEKHRSEKSKNVRDLDFCSPECWYEHNQLENHSGYEGGQDERNNPQSRIWRNDVLKRDKYHCRYCRIQGDLQVHHIKRFATHPDIRWEVSNGVTLCRECHKLFYGIEEQYADVLSFVAQLPIEVWA
jgi:5-methylcytosine-specific restriction endonuclease McrA